MRFVAAIMLFLLSIINFCTAQTGDQLCELHGGFFNLDFTVSANLLHELGAPLGATGQIAACSYPSPTNAASNPAGWAFQKQRQIAIEFAPGIKTDLSRYYDVRTEIESAVNNSIADFRQPNSEIIYPNLIPRAGLASGFTRARLAIPGSGGLKKWTFAMQICQSGLIDFQTSGNGLSVLMETEKQIGDELKLIRLRMNSNLSAKMQTSVFNLNFDAACRIARKWAVGVSLRRYCFAVDAKGELLVDGIIQTAGTEYVFNDPYDKRIDFDAGEQNTLDQKFNAGFNGSAWGIVLGANWFPANWVQLGISVDVKPKIELTGDMDVKFNRIPALTLESEGGSDTETEFLDPTKLNLAKLTLTEPAFNKTTDRIHIRLPSVIHLGVRLGRARTNVGINYSLYIGDTSCEVLGREYGLRVGHGVGFDTSFGFFRLGLGAIFARSFVREQNSSPSFSNIVVIPMTTFVLDFGGKYGVHLVSSVIVSPLPIIGLTVAYTF